MEARVDANEEHRAALRSKLWEQERRLVSRLPKPLKRPYLEVSHFLATQLRMHNVRFPVTSNRFGKMLLNRVDTVNAFIYYFGFWEPGVTALLDATLDDGDVFIDVGANVGYYSLCAAKRVGPKGHVYALEASPTIHRRLCEHVAMNHLDNVEAINCAVWNEETELEIFLGPNKNQGNTSVTPSKKHLRECKVRAAPLDALIDANAIARAAVVKIDVEGAEAQVVAGMMSCLDELPHHVMILVEVTKRLLEEQGQSLEAMLRPFADRGFRFFAIPNEYNFGFYLDRPEPRVELREVSFEHILNGPEPRFDLAISRRDLGAI